MTATLDAMETAIRLERALASGRAVGETADVARAELAAARAEIQPQVSESMDWAFEQVATARADRRRLEGALAKARRTLKKAEEEGAAAAAAAAKKYVGVRAALEVKKTPPAVIAAQKEIADAEQTLADLEKNIRFLVRLVEEECEFLDGMASIREWSARGRVGNPPSCAVAWIAATRQTADMLYPLSPLPVWSRNNEERMYTDVADSADEDQLLWSFPEPIVEEKPVAAVVAPVTRPKKPVIPADETPAQRKRRMLFRKLNPVAA